MPTDNVSELIAKLKSQWPDYAVTQAVSALHAANCALAARVERLEANVDELTKDMCAARSWYDKLAARVEKLEATSKPPQPKRDITKKSAHGAMHHRVECECDVCYPPETRDAKEQACMEAMSKPPQEVREQAEPTSKPTIPGEPEICVCPSCQSVLENGWCNSCDGWATELLVAQPAPPAYAALGRAVHKLGWKPQAAPQPACEPLLALCERWKEYALQQRHYHNYQAESAYFKCAAELRAALAAREEMK